jgi:hypothetical protein
VFPHTVKVGKSESPVGPTIDVDLIVIVDKARKLLKPSVIHFTEGFFRLVVSPSLRLRVNLDQSRVVAEFRVKITGRSEFDSERVRNVCINWRYHCAAKQR